MNRPAAPADDAPGDRDLVAAANRGDAAAMEQLYFRHRDWVYSLALRFTRDPDDAADTAQEVFFYLFQKFPGLELSCELRSLLFPAVRNVAIRLRQRRARSQPLEATAEPAAPALPERGDIAGLVACLPEEQREVVLLRFAEDLSFEEIARRLDLPLGTVKSRLHRALGELKARLQGE
jgi:RNA polymerase sigma-70 factor (ECF subfamily)